MPSIAQTLVRHGIDKTRLDGFVVVSGPGSFTGLRVGIMAAKTLAYAVKIPLIAIPTFRAIALQSPRDARQVEVSAPARTGRGAGCSGCPRS